MTDWIEWAKILLPLLMTAGGLAGAMGAVAGAVGACMSIRYQQSKARSDARKSEIDADKGSIELLKTLMERVEEQAAKILALQEDNRRALMREVDLKTELAEQKTKIEQLTEGLRACEEFRMAAVTAAQQLQTLPKVGP